MATLVLQHSAIAGLGTLGTVLRSHGHRMQVVRIDRGEPVPGDLDNVDAIIALGGGMSVNDASLPWLTGELTLLRQAHAREIPILGLCLGCQLLAKALGGSVERMPAGIELGWHDVKLSTVGREDPIFAGIPWTSRQFHWHREHVSKLPAGGRVLASSKGCGIQAWCSGVRTYAVQYHPEVTRTMIDDWCEDEPAALGEASTSIQALREQTEREFPAFERLAVRLFESIALLHMPVDRRARGLVKDLHH